MSDDHDLIIRLDEKVGAAEENIKDLQSKSATKEALEKLEASLGQFKIGLIAVAVAIGGSVANFLLNLIDRGTQ